MTSCLHCESAKTHPDYAGTDQPHGTCKGCEIRETARSPRRLREQRYSEVLRTRGEEACEAYRKAVLEEYRRIDGLREHHG